MSSPNSAPSWSESFISMEQVVAAAFALGFIRESPGSCDIALIVARMTGLDMGKYELVPTINLHGWHIVLKASA